MRRELDINEVSDGKLYTSNDMVKMGCDDCSGCSDCCEGMGESILLDSYDIYQLTKNLGCSFDALLGGGTLGQEVIGLGIVDGLILPHLNMVGEWERCVFLSDEGRCKIHAFSSGILQTVSAGADL